METITTHIYGRNAHDIYTVLWGDEESVTVDNGSYEAISSNLSDVVIPNDVIVGVLDGIEKASGIELTKEERLNLVKSNIIRLIGQYDTSKAVNSFVLDGKEMWLPKDTRVGLRNSVSVEKDAGRTETTLWYGGASYVVPIDMALALLSRLELYALTCYNVTESHKASVMAMDNVEDVTAYDYKTGYPDRMVVSL